jgi:signal transduction histidine kinase
LTTKGEGIDEKVMKQIFDPFFTTRREQGGTGLGLAISHRIVQDHGGSLHFTSTPGKGTTVHVAFPMTKAGHEERRRRKIPNEHFFESTSPHSDC